MKMAANLDEATIYQIFRSCRLCGAGGGYKMPILPSVVGLDYDTQLQQKIRDCVQIEVQEDDKMPPLICELCVDKVNDFYEFLEMCQKTNQSTRQRLGLPMAASRAESEVDCILGVTEPVYTQMSDDEPLSRNRMVRPVKVRGDGKSDKNDKSRQESRSSRESRSSIRDRRDSCSSNSSKRSTRDQQRSSDRIKPPLKRDSKPVVINLDDDDEDDSLLVPRTKKSKMEKLVAEPKSLRSQKAETKMPEPKSLRSRTDTKTPISEPKSLRSKTETTPSIEQKSLRSRPEIKTHTQDVEPKSLRSKTESKTPINESKGSKAKPEKDVKKDKGTPVEEKQAKIKPQSKPVPSSRPGPKSSKKIESPPPPPVKPAQSANKSKQRPGPKSSKRPVSPSLPPSPRPASPVSAPLSCGICAQSCSSAQGLSSHLRMHAVRFTAPHLACNPCGDWFLTPEETTAHHKWHKNSHVLYACRACHTSYRQYKDYDRHMTESGANHVPWQEVADVKCEQCWRLFPTGVLLRQHKCGGDVARPGGKCKKCNRHYQLHKNLVKHQATCAGKKKTIDINDLIIDPEVRESLLPMRVKVVNCDPLLKGKKQRCDVTTVPLNYGFDPRSTYPYRFLVRVKREPLEFDGMVSINTEIRDEFYKEEDYVHWDSDNSSDSDSEFLTLNPEDRTQKVPSLTALSLRTIYSRRCLGKVPKRLRKVKQDKFDAMFNTDNDFDNIRNDYDNFRNNIDNIIDNLGGNNYGSDGKTIDNIQISETFSITDNFDMATSFETTTNLNFDSLKNSSKSYENISLNSSYNYESCNTNEGENKNDDDKTTDASLDETEEISQSSRLQSNINDSNDLLKDKNSVDAVDSISDDANNSLKDNVDSTNSLEDSPGSSKVFIDKNIDNDTLKNKSAVTSTPFHNYTIDSLLENQPEKNDLALQSDIGNNVDNITEKQNGACATDKITSNGTDSNDLITEINDLYDKKLMDDLDAEIGL